MKFNFRKISAVLTSGLMAISGAGFAAAANFPAPFVVGGSSAGAVVYGTGAGALDMTPANSIGNYLSGLVTVGTGAPSGESLIFDSSSNNLNLGDTWKEAETGTIDEVDLPNLLAKGTYIATDNDEFKYEQSIKLGAATLTHFRNSDYESLAGLPTKTPTIGFQINSNIPVLNYTLDFTTDAETDIVGTDMDDIEGSNIVLFGKTYYISDLKNGTAATYAGKMTLLDSATVSTVSEGETVTVTSGGTTYEVSMIFLDADEVKYLINGKEFPSSGKLNTGDNVNIGGDVYLGVTDISKAYETITGSSTLSIGSGKLEITSDAEIKLNDDTISGVKGYVFQTSGASSSEKIDKITIEWVADDRIFLTAESELEMPGFGGIKFSMSDLVRPTEEKITIDKDGDTSMKLSLPTTDGDVSFNFLYSNASGEFIGIGQDNTSRLATANANVLTFYQRRYATTWDDWFVATYNVSSEAESHVLRAKISQTSGVNYTSIEKMDGIGSWTEICEDVKDTGDCSIGDIVLTTSETTYNTGSGEKSVIFTGNAGVNFNTIYTKGGLRIYLPYEGANTSLAMGLINFSVTNYGGPAGHGMDTFWLFADGENKDDTIAAGTEFNLTIDDSSNKLQVSQINGLASVSADEVGQSTGVYETYMVDDVAPRMVHYTKSDNDDYAEIYYPEGDSETYAQVYLTELGSTISAAGQMVFKDTEKSSWSNKNVVIVGGSCINSAAATLLGGDLCEDAFTDVTGVGAGKYLIQSYADGFTSGKIALLVAGYHAADTVAAASRLIEIGAAVDTTAGTKYIGTVGVSGSSTMSKQ